jgi:hypothetical protein
VASAGAQPSEVSGRLRRILQPEIALVVIAVVIASFQVYYSKLSDLTTWRGGGFGMYSDAHPSNTRRVWLVGGGNDRENAIRLYPVDPRMSTSGLPNTPLRHDLYRLHDAAHATRNFPARADLCGLAEQIEQFRRAHPDAEATRALPEPPLSLVVVEVLLSPDYETVTSNSVSTRPLCKG